MKKHSIVIIALLLFILPAYAEVTEWIYITRGNHFLVMDPQTREIIKQESLPEKESYNIFTTPGGKFLFLVASHDDTKAIVIDTETHAVMHSETLPPNTTRIAFSSMGDRMYSGTDTKYVSVSDHRRSRFSNTQTLQTSLGTGEIAFNRRGTRIYGNNKTGLAYFLEQDLSIIQEIRLRKVYNWFAASNFRFLFGIALDKTKIVSIDERKAKKIAELKVDVQDAKINHRGDTVFVLTNNEILRLQFPKFTLQDSIPLPKPADTLTIDQHNSVYALSTDGNTIFAYTDEAVQSIDLSSFWNAAETKHTRTQFALTTIKPGQGFACF